LIDVDSQRSNGHYRRALEIVNAEPQRYRRFIAELNTEAVAGNL